MGPKKTHESKRNRDLSDKCERLIKKKGKNTFDRIPLFSAEF